MDVRINAGYTITDSIHVGNVEFVIGESRSAPAMFVTWECKGKNNYYWGHYLTGRMAAVRDLLDRAGKELEYQERQQARQIPQAQKTGKERER